MFPVEITFPGKEIIPADVMENKVVGPLAIRNNPPLRLLSKDPVIIGECILIVMLGLQSTVIKRLLLMMLYLNFEHISLKHQVRQEKYFYLQLPSYSWI